MKKLLEFLQGYKTYIVSVFIAIYTLLKVFNVIITTPEQDIAVYGLLTALFGVTIAAKINRLY